MTAAIEVRDVSKRFKISLDKHDSLKERLLKIGKRKGFEEFYALRDIDFSVDTGETMALLGHNGSGKSTLLKCVGGILRPTAGEIRTRGRVASLLELGAGFHPDLSGRENVYLNGSILGMSRKDIDARFDEIVGFAELEQFIDNQVKHYSSGMYIRLGFAVAVNVEPDILLVDEVLAVGDELFQQKCLARIRDFQHDGRTIVVVSHSTDLVRQISDRIVVLDHGRQVDVAEPTEAIRSFRRYLHGSRDAHGEVVPDQASGHSHRVRIRNVDLGAAANSPVTPADELCISVSYEVREPLDDVVFALHVLDTSGRLVYGVNSEILLGAPSKLDHDGTIHFDLHRLPLLDGHYKVSIGIHDHEVVEHYDQADEVASFEVLGAKRVQGIADLSATLSFD